MRPLFTSREQYGDDTYREQDTWFEVAVALVALIYLMGRSKP